MAELKVPLFDSYLEIQKAAKEEAYYLNSVIASQLRTKNLALNIEILAEASESPEVFGLLDGNKNTLKPRTIRNKRFLRYDGSVTFDSNAFELWYHNIHPEGKKRAAFFESLGENDKMQLKYYKNK